MAVNADRRVGRQLAKGGPVSLRRKSAARRTATRRAWTSAQLFTQAKLDPPMLSRSLQQAAREVHSDYDLAETLIAAAKHQAIDGALMDFVSASRSVKPDYDEGRVLQQAITRPGVTPAVAAAVFSAATPAADNSGIQSDMDRFGGVAQQDAAPAYPSSRRRDGPRQSRASARRTAPQPRHRGRAETRSGPCDGAGCARGGVGHFLGLRPGDAAHECVRRRAERPDGQRIPRRDEPREELIRSRSRDARDRESIFLAIESLAQAVGLAATMSSDYDRAEAFIALSRARGMGPATKKALSDSAAAMHGESDRGRVLEALSSAGVH